MKLEGRHDLLLNVLAAIIVSLLSPLAKASASERTVVGFVPPANPPYYCNPKLPSWLAAVDYCRAHEHVGPLELPSNYGLLTVPEQMLVIFDLERVNRGEVPITGLSATLDGYAQRGAEANTDPSFPQSGFGAGGGIWIDGLTTLEADNSFMYTDDCSPTHVDGCWGHRDFILYDRHPARGLVAGAGYDAKLGSYTFEVLQETSPPANLAFSWADELRYFSTPPAAEPLRPPKVTLVSPALGATSGNTLVMLTGSNLSSTRTISFGSEPAAGVSCTSDTTCTARTPKVPPGLVDVSVTALGGSTTDSGAFRFVAPLIHGRGRIRVSEPSKTGP